MTINEVTYTDYTNWIAGLKMKVDPYSEKEWNLMDNMQRHLIARLVVKAENNA